MSNCLSRSVENHGDADHPWLTYIIQDLDEFIREGPGNKDEANIVVEKLRA